MQQLLQLGYMYTSVKCELPAGMIPACYTPYAVPILRRTQILHQSFLGHVFAGFRAHQFKHRRYRHLHFHQNYLHHRHRSRSIYEEVGDDGGAHSATFFSTRAFADTQFQLPPLLPPPPQKKKMLLVDCGRSASKRKQ